MRSHSLRLILCAGAALVAPAALAQDARPSTPPPSSTPPASAASPEQDPPPAPAVVIEPGEASPADGVAAPPADPAPVAIPEVWSPTPTDGQGRSAYGLYLSGRLAGMRGQGEISADYLQRTQALTPEQPAVADEAFRAALFAGDVDAVARLTPEVSGTRALVEPGRLFQVVQALRRGDGDAARAALTGETFTAPFSAVARYLGPVVAATAGDWDAALAPTPDTAPDDPAQLVLADQRAQLLELRRRHDDAEAEFAELVAGPDGRRLYGVHYGAFLERRGRPDAARAVYQASLTSSAPDPRAIAALRRVEAGGRAPRAPTLNAIAGDALVFGAIEASAAGIDELAVIYLQMASALSPDDAVTLRLAQALARAEHDALARDAFARVGQADPIQYAAAQIALAQSLADEDRDDEALAALRRADARAPGQIEVSRRLAGQLLDMQRDEEALAVLNRPAVNTADQRLDFRYLRGAALSRLGRLDEAEAELWTALQASPDNPALLNQLGYLWVDSGRRVEQGAEMLARAHAAEPTDGNIQDSLGWAQYRQGQYDQAVETLEQAVAKEPANAEINDHLGDAYWQVGRRREAEWQWSRVLTLAPDAERRASVEGKLASGLAEPAPASAASQP